jgi:hypothetical protein
MLVEPLHYQWNWEVLRTQREFGIRSQKKVWVMREITNDREHGLGLPLPKGRVRFYRSDRGGAQFVGESALEHTAEGETLRLYTGDAFDLAGERVRTQFNTDSGRWTDEGFEIRLRNRKKEAVEVRVVERLIRWNNWEILQKSDPFEKLDSHTVEFRITLPPGAQKVVSYFVHYSW